MPDMTKPSYFFEVWREEPFWLARVTGGANGYDETALKLMTQGFSLKELEEMARDLIATFFDISEDTFDVQLTKRANVPQ